METVEYHGHTIRKWTIGSSTYVAWPERGARLMDWHLRLEDGSTRDIVYWPETHDLTKFGEIRGGNPILFPFCGRTFANGKIGFWEFEGVRRPMPMHGFVREGTFAIDEIDEGGFTANFIPAETDQSAYDFKYQFSVKYRFRELSLQVDLFLSNLDSKTIPWSAGHHFYFRLPWHTDLGRSDYRIEIPARSAYYHASDGHLEPIKKFSTDITFADPQAQDRIHSHLMRNPVRFGPLKGEENISMYVGANPVPDKDATIVTWTESPDAPFFCVEPWMGPPNSPEHRSGFRLVPAGMTDSFTVEVSLI
ncbi:MAG: Protein LacX, plasmid [Candidatus Moanabacter tarae]|uniref:Protein LacX, plasmid n=1 Tax=Candidatus Moanibacter tarae TaxID=2200854 RepID=A0A2Z4AEL6_9BACT|nr:MAG: Protein LacX, plasmid [Candidatus Moanabacter tarae]|tara:strand:+ start:561 stop:1478 length:918 start_codon:yes stop_codon:yes gene_type:complete